MNDLFSGMKEHGPGLCSVSGPLLSLDKALDDVFLGWAEELGAPEVRFPAFLAAKHLHRLQYFSSFPHLATFAAPLSREPAVLQRFADRAHVDEDGAIELGAEAMAPVTHVVTPAACYHAYVELEGRELQERTTLTTRATCCRQEDRYVPLERQWTFSMREIVCVGTPDEVAAFLEEAAAKLSRFVDRLKLPVAWQSATDPFFAPAKNPKYVFQRLEPVKRELVLDGRLALASTNDHRTYFGEAFGLTRDGAALSSGCIAFGVERWLSAFRHTFGDDAARWPDVKEAARG